MKKFLLFGAAALCAWSMSNAAITIDYVNVAQPVQDTVFYQMPFNIQNYQDIQNYPSNNTEARVMRFQPEYLVTAKDFSVGYTEKGSTPTLPKNAKVVGLSLEGYDVASEPDSHGLFVEVCAWCRNISADVLSHEHIEIFDGYKKYAPEGELYIDTVNYRNTWADTPGFLSYFDTEADSVNPGTLVDVPFNNPDAKSALNDNGYKFDKNYPPFWYKGENIILTLWVSNFNWIKMKYRYLTYTDAEAEIASLFRTGNICFNNNTLTDVKQVLGMDLMYDLPKHSLPAFKVPYYTNDIRIDINPESGISTSDVVLKDSEGNVIEPDEDGVYRNLDHEKTYVVVVADEESNPIVFDDIYKDIVVNVKKDRTAVNELDTNREVSAVRYYNVAGMESSNPFSGMNIVVTTYSDGTTSTSKVVK